MITVYVGEMDFSVYSNVTRSLFWQHRNKAHNNASPYFLQTSKDSLRLKQNRLIVSLHQTLGWKDFSIADISSSSSAIFFGPFLVSSCHLLIFIATLMNGKW
jgi:hypothetical protein